MALIYVPKGPAKEYAELALNYYKGCGYKCKYCYVPGFFKMLGSKYVNFNTVSVVGPNKMVNENDKIDRIYKILSKEAKVLSGDNRRVLMCFTSDPYQPIEKEKRITRKCLEILGENNVKVTILTKNPVMAMELDSDLIVKYDVELASTIIWADDNKRIIWEPNTGTIQSRINEMENATKNNIKTWVSIEPIIDPDEVLRVIDLLSGKVCKLKIGLVDPRWNPDEYKKIDWTKLLKQILNKLISNKQNYYIKNKLWDYADFDIQHNFKKEYMVV